MTAGQGVLRPNAVRIGERQSGRLNELERRTTTPTFGGSKAKKDPFTFATVGSPIVGMIGSFRPMANESVTGVTVQLLGSPTSQTTVLVRKNGAVIGGGVVLLPLPTSYTNVIVAPSVPYVARTDLMEVVIVELGAGVTGVIVQVERG